MLTERYYSWEDARKLASTDSEVDLSGEGPPYTPGHFEDDALDGEEEFLAESDQESGRTTQNVDTVPEVRENVKPSHPSV